MPSCVRLSVTSPFTCLLCLASMFAATLDIDGALHQLLVLLVGDVLEVHVDYADAPVEASG